MTEKKYKSAIECGQEFLAINHKMKKLFAGRSGRNELYQGEFMTLNMIQHMILENKSKQNVECGAKVGDIGKRLITSKSATSKMLRSLEEKDYIERTTMPRDRRTVYVRLTDKGNKLVTESKNKMNQFAVEVIEELGLEEMDVFLGMMNKLYDIMSNKIDIYFENEGSDDNEKGDGLC